MLSSSRCGTGQIRLLTIVVLLAALAGLVVVLLNDRATKTSRVEVPAVPPEISRTNLVLEGGRLRPKGGTNLFTGLMVEHYPDGAQRSRSAVLNGQLHGLSEGWHTNGQIQVSEQFKEGVSHGARTKWYPDGVKQSEAAIVEGKLHGPFRRWHENGVLSEQIEFVADQPEGVSMSYFPSGCLKARVVMKDGKPVEQQFWKDGERKP